MPSELLRAPHRGALVVALASLSVACGPGGGMNGDAAVDAAPVARGWQMGGGDGGGIPANCTNPCTCADRGPADFSREDAGMPSPTSNADQQAALQRTNHWRSAAGLQPINFNEQIEQAAAAHAHLMATTPQGTCWPGVHNEVVGPQCPGSTGADPGARMSAAGYSWRGYGEVINWEQTPAGSIDGWMWTVYHRQPFMSALYPEAGWAREQGGSLGMNTVMDFGVPRTGATPPAPTQPWIFPPPGQTGVPTRFAGWTEGPTPPAPVSLGAWPRNVFSGPVLSVHFPNTNFAIREAHLYVASSCAPLEFTQLSYMNDANLRRSSNSPDVFFYANAPLASMTEHVMQVTVEFNAMVMTRTWAFTTQ